MNTVRINGQDYTSSLTDAEIAFIGNLSLPTTAQTLSGAIAEHETDISELNSNLTPETKYITISIPNSGGENYISKTGNTRHIQLRIIGTTISEIASLTIGSIVDSSDYPVRNVICQGVALDGNGYPIHNMIFNIGADGSISCVNGNATAYGFVLNISYIR